MAGPTTGYPDLNYPAFTAACAKLRARNCTVVSPHELNQKSVPWRDAMVKDIRALLGCNRIVLLPGWQKSKGAQIERAIGIAFGMEIEELEPRPPVKRLSISRRIDLIFAFFRDARHIPLHRTAEVARANENLAREVQRQIENAIRDDRELRNGVPLEFTDEDLCPACGIPVEGHGLIETGKWKTRICAGVSGQNLFIIGPEAAQAFVIQLKEQDARELREIADREPAAVAAGGE